MPKKLVHIKTSWLVAVAIFLVAGDLAYSFYQHSQYPMEGDMEESVLPRDYLIPLYQDPFGVKMLVNHEPHAAPNRFFSQSPAKPLNLTSGTVASPCGNIFSSMDFFNASSFSSAFSRPAISASSKRKNEPIRRCSSESEGSATEMFITLPFEMLYLDIP